MKAFPILAVAAALSACVSSTPEWTREYATSVTTKTFKGASSAAVVKAAEDVLRLADGADVTFSYGQGSFVAQRSYSLYMVIAASMGTYTYQVTTVPSAGGVTVSISIADQNSAILPGAVVPAITTTTSVSAGQVQFAEPYLLYFARMEYLLGQRPDWISCAGAKGKLGGDRAAYDPLCLAAKDDAPNASAP